MPPPKGKSNNPAGRPRGIKNASPSSQGLAQRRERREWRREQQIMEWLRILTDETAPAAERTKAAIKLLPEYERLGLL